MFGGCEKSTIETVTHPLFVADFDFELIYRHSNLYLSGLLKYKPEFPKDKLTSVTLPDISSALYGTEPGASKATGLKALALRIAYRLLWPFTICYDVLILRSIIIRSPAKILHVNNGGYPGATGCLAAAWAGRLCGKTVFMTVNNSAQPRRGISGIIEDFLTKKTVSLFITGSKSSGRELCARRGFEQTKTTNIYHGIPEIEIPAVGLNPLQICMISLLEERKGHRYVLQALRRTLDETPEFAALKLVIIGDGPLRGELERLTSELRLENNVEFRGYQTEYLELLAGSAVLLNPSTGYEDLPYVIIEAMRAAVPVIGTPIAGIPEEIEDGKTGIIVPARDAAAISTALKKILSAPDLRAEMSANAKSRFLTIFTLDAMAKGYHSLYKTP